MNGWQSDVRAFHRKFKLANPDTPKLPSNGEILDRRELMREEFEELKRAMEARDMVEVADGIVDLIYTAVGTAVEFGIDLEPLWAEVHRSNMEKVLPDEGDFKIKKPAGWVAPWIRLTLWMQGWDKEEGNGE